jgi:uncharacterized LabA/DUF88 family protein
VKWLDLQKLSGLFIGSQSEQLSQVLYFSSFATHMSEAIQARQKAYIHALQLRGVRPILGQFKNKERFCPHCSSRWMGHEEKETDVNIALGLLDLASQNAYDRALLVSNDSDLAPAVRKVLERFPNKKITIVAPPLSRQCNELIHAASNKTKINIHHLERCLFPEVVSDASGLISVKRPFEYAYSPTFV